MKQDLLLSITKNCETLIKQTHRKAETLEFKLGKSRETFHFKPPVSIEWSCMIGLTNLEVYNSIFKITEEKNKFKLYTISDLLNGKDIFEVVRIIVEKMGISDFTTQDLLDETIGPILIEEHRKAYQEKNRANPLIKLLHRHKSSIFQDFESFLRTQVDMAEDDIRLLLD